MIQPLKIESPLTPKQRAAREHSINRLREEVDRVPSSLRKQVWAAIHEHVTALEQGVVTSKTKGSFV